MKVKAKKLFHGMISVRDYLVIHCLENGEDLEIELTTTGETMEISFDDLEIKRISKQAFKSKHNNRVYRLVDFPWKPTQTRQRVLL